MPFAAQWQAKRHERAEEYKGRERRALAQDVRQGGAAAETGGHGADDERLELGEEL